MFTYILDPAQFLQNTLLRFLLQLHYEYALFVVELNSSQ